MSFRRISGPLTGFLLGSALLGTLPLAPANGKEIPPAPRYYVLDEPGILSPSIREALQSLLVEHDHATGEQVVLAIFAGLDGEDSVDWTNRAFAAWKIGQRGKDNGILLALYWKDRKARIEVGYGLEPLLTDARSKTVLSEFLIPELKNGNPDRAIALAAVEILRVIESPLITSGRATTLLRSGGLRGGWKAQSGGEGEIPLPWLVLALIVTLVALRMLTSVDAHFTGGGWYRSRPTFDWRRRGSWSAGPGWGTRGGRSSGGGFLGGGGLSGGGGASGDW
ncbi:MAG: TPM domain-containing protein [Oligoflexia bacterium]|nr:TPM domain-containing protein [Oligoflexia bacterium]